MYDSPRSGQRKILFADDYADRGYERDRHMDIYRALRSGDMRMLTYPSPAGPTLLPSPILSSTSEHIAAWTKLL